MRPCCPWRHRVLPWPCCPGPPALSRSRPGVLLSTGGRVMLLAGDIGGTKTALAVFSPEAGPRVPHAQAEFPSASYPNLEAIVRAFRAQITPAVGGSQRFRLPIDQACFAVAGPVIAGRAKITNLPWVI